MRIRITETTIMTHPNGGEEASRLTVDKVYDITQTFPDGVVIKDDIGRNHFLYSDRFDFVYDQSTPTDESSSINIEESSNDLNGKRVKIVGRSCPSSGQFGWAEYSKTLAKTAYTTYYQVTLDSGKVLKGICDEYLQEVSEEPPYELPQESPSYVTIDSLMSMIQDTKTCILLDNMSGTPCYRIETEFEADVVLFEFKTLQDAAKAIESINLLMEHKV